MTVYTERKRDALHEASLFYWRRAGLEIVSDADRKAVVAHRALAVALLDQIQAADVVTQPEVNAFPDDACTQTHAQVGTLEQTVVTEDVGFLAAGLVLYFAADAESVIKTCEGLDRNDILDIEMIVEQYGNLDIGGAEIENSEFAAAAREGEARFEVERNTVLSI